METTKKDSIVDHVAILIRFFSLRNVVQLVTKGLDLCV